MSERDRNQRLAPMDITYDHLIAWRAEHEATTGDELDRLRCPSCEALDPARMLFGMPAGWPPDWLAVGGGVIGPDRPSYQCRTCGHRW